MIKRIICINEKCSRRKKCKSANSEQLMTNVKTEYKKIPQDKSNNCIYFDNNYIKDTWGLRKRILMIGG